MDHINRFRVLLSLSLLCVVALTACGAPAGQPGPQPSTAAGAPTPQPASAEEAIRQLILLEGRGVVSQDITGLMNLWAPEAVITDAKHTPSNPDDDAHWRGRDAIRSRYVVLVFPGNPQVAGARDIHVTIEGDKATATSTTVIGSEVSPGGDRWTFVRRDGRWWIAGLTYNLEPK
jgi:hypothetical protein